MRRQGPRHAARKPWSWWRSPWPPLTGLTIALLIVLIILTIAEIAGWVIAW